jgi:hypothetical protein
VNIARRALIVAAIVVALAACGGEKPDQAAGSWSATLQMTAEKWLDNSVPSRFVASTCDAADKALEKFSGPEIDKARAASSKLKEAVQRGDRRAAREVAEELRR